MKTESDKSLQDVHGSVNTSARAGGWRRLFAFLGPAYLVSVGYMDPGNWATDIAGGSKFGYALIWVLVLSNLMALLLQSLSARLGLVAGMDLAQASRAYYPKAVNRSLWFLAEIAIAACDLAEVLGMAIGLQLLFHLPLLAGIGITVLDTFLILVLQRFGIRKMEAFIISLIAIIGLAFITEMFFAHPDIHGILSGLKPTLPNDEALYIAIGIIGATVMPHNLYLHSSLVQTRSFERTELGIRQAIRFNVIDSFIALNLALFVNAAILILAASSFYSNGLHEISSIQDAYHLLGDLLGTMLAPTFFAIALIAAGQSSTLTGTLSGQIVMEGYLNLRLQPWLRRLITRLIAIIPAALVIAIAGEEKTDDLLVLSQVVLSLQLGFAVIPLIHFVSDRKLMGKFTIGLWLKIPAWLSAGIIVGLNAKLVYATLANELARGENTILLWCTAVPVTVAAALLLIWITLRPLLRPSEKKQNFPHALPETIGLQKRLDYKKIAVCVDFSITDSEALSHAVQQGGKEAVYLLVHIVETVGARVMQGDTADFETDFDEKALAQYAEQLQAQGFRTETKLGFGNPKKCIPEIVNQSDCELLVMGAHGHRFFHDILFGTTVEEVRHSVRIPVLIVRKS